MNAITKMLNAAADARLAAEDSVKAAIEAAAAVLELEGWSRDYASVYNSIYLKRDGVTLRIADHWLPSCISTADYRPWSAGPEVIYARCENPADVRERILAAARGI